MDDWDQIRAMFERCIDLDPQARTQLLLQARPEIRIEVEDLLRSHEEGEGLFREGDGARHLGELTYLHPKVGERIGGYLLVEELGQGGTGTVYRAEQSQPRRSVAVKILSSAFVGPRNQQRFQLEIELLSRLRHEGIANVFDAGFTDLRTGLGEVRIPYYVREFVEDSRTLDDWRDAEARSESEVLRVVLDVARAMRHAHARGVVHQDLKPQNVLIDRLGRIKIIDFGSGRLLGDSGSQVLKFPHRTGTPAYMAPEQFELDSGAADTRIDVHALGLIAFELLSGEPVFGDRDDDARALESQIRGARRPRLRDRLRGASRELDAILAKAMHVDPEMRYREAGALAQDFERYLAGAAVEAYAGGILYQVRVWARRNRAAAGLAALLLVSVAVLGVAIQAENSRALAAERALVEASRDETEATLRAIDMAIHAITDLPRSMSFSLSDPSELRAYWLRNTVSNLQLLEQAVPKGPVIALAMARAYAAIAQAKLRLPGPIRGEEIAPDALDRAAEYVAAYADGQPEGRSGSLLDTIEFEIGTWPGGRTTSFIALAMMRQAMLSSDVAPRDEVAAYELKFALAVAQRAVGRGDIAGGLELYRVELEKQKGGLLPFAESSEYPKALLALRRRVAAIESFQGRGGAAERLLRDAIELYGLVPPSLRSPAVEYEAAMAELALGSLLSRGGAFVEGETLITGGAAKLEELGESVDPATYTKAVVKLRVAQFLLERGSSDLASSDREGFLREAVAIASGVRWQSASGQVGEPSIVRLLIDRECRRIVLAVEALLGD